MRVVLADDHPVVLAGLEQVFAQEPDCEVVATATDGEQALAAVERLAPDVLVLDLRMPRKDGLAVLRDLAAGGAATRTVVLTAAVDGNALEAIRLGARGLVLKDMPVRLLVEAVRKVGAGQQWLAREVGDSAVARLLRQTAEDRSRNQSLTLRELEIARLTAQGYANKEVARKLDITEGTVKVHLHHVYEKLGLHGRMALVRYLRGSGFESL